jgi:hypothetical protein
MCLQLQSNYYFKGMHKQKLDQKEGGTII